LALKVHQTNVALFDIQTDKSVETVETQQQQQPATPPRKSTEEKAPQTPGNNAATPGKKPAGSPEKASSVVAPSTPTRKSTPSAQQQKQQQAPLASTLAAVVAAEGPSKLPAKMANVPAHSENVLKSSSSAKVHVPSVDSWPHLGAAVLVENTPAQPSPPASPSHHQPAMSKEDSSQEGNNNQGGRNKKNWSKLPVQIRYTSSSAGSSSNKSEGNKSNKESKKQRNNADNSSNKDSYKENSKETASSSKEANKAEAGSQKPAEKTSNKQQTPVNNTSTDKQQQQSKSSSSSKESVTSTANAALAGNASTSSSQSNVQQQTNGAPQTHSKKGSRSGNNKNSNSRPQSGSKSTPSSPRARSVSAVPAPVLPDNIEQPGSAAASTASGPTAVGPRSAGSQPAGTQPYRKFNHARRSHHTEHPHNHHHHHTHPSGGPPGSNYPVPMARGGPMNKSYSSRSSTGDGYAMPSYYYSYYAPGSMGMEYSTPAATQWAPIDPSTGLPVSMHPLENVKTYLRSQIEYYYSVENLCRDMFFRKQMSPQHGGVPLKVISAFNRVKNLLEMGKPFYNPSSASTLMTGGKSPKSTEGEKNKESTVSMETWLNSLLEDSLRSSSTIRVFRTEESHEPFVGLRQGWDYWILSDSPGAPSPTTASAPLSNSTSSGNGSEGTLNGHKVSSSKPSYAPSMMPNTKSFNNNNSHYHHNNNNNKTYNNGGHMKKKTPIQQHQQQHWMPTPPLSPLSQRKAEHGANSILSDALLGPKNGGVSRSNVGNISLVLLKEKSVTFGNQRVQLLSDKMESIEAYLKDQEDKENRPESLLPIPRFWMGSEDEFLSPIGWSWTSQLTLDGMDAALTSELTTTLYTTFREQALSERHSNGKVSGPKMNHLFSFWTQFLPYHFNMTMYTEFKKLAMEDAASKESSMFGMTCYYSMLAQMLKNLKAKEFKEGMDKIVEELRNVVNTHQQHDQKRSSPTLVSCLPKDLLSGDFKSVVQRFV
jgi:hypothetical protein